MAGTRGLVSIVLPVYNGSRFLRRSIDSCLRQTYRDLELLVVDDGSKDNSVEIVKFYNDDRIKLICHERNRKLPAALNTGFSHSSGAYLTWTSHDNYYADTAIAEMVKFLEENPTIGYVFTSEYIIDEADQVLRVFKPGPIEQLPESSCLGGGFLYRRAVYETIGPYDERAFLAEDYDYWLRALAHFSFAHLDVPLYYYSWHPNSLSSRVGQKGTDVALAVRRRILGRNLWRNRRVLSRSHLAAAYYFYDKNNRTAAARAIAWAVAFDPSSLLHYRVPALIAKLCCGQKGVQFLRGAKHAMLRVATRDR